MTQAEPLPEKLFDTVSIIAHEGAEKAILSIRISRPVLKRYLEIAEAIRAYQIMDSQDRNGTMDLEHALDKPEFPDDEKRLYDIMRSAIAYLHPNEDMPGRGSDANRDLAIKVMTKRVAFIREFLKSETEMLTLTAERNTAVAIKEYERWRPFSNKEESAGLPDAHPSARRRFDDELWGPAIEAALRNNRER